MATGNSLSALKKQLQEAKKQAAKAATIFESLGGGLIVTNEYGFIEQVNELCQEILGYTKAEMLGQPYMKLVRAVYEDGSPIEPLDRPLIRTFLSGKPISERLYFLTKNGTPIPAELSVSPITDHGQPIGAVVVFRDLTNQFVQEKVQFELMSLAAHQLRTPLSTINTYAQMLTQGYAGKLNKRQAGFAGIIETSAERMNELIHSLLNAGQVEAGSISVNPKRIDIDTICLEVIASLTPMAKQKNQKIDYLNSAISSLETDPVLLREILSNLLTNAIKYTPSGGQVSLSIKAKERLVFAVKDNGYGIPEQAKEYIFAKFYRANNVMGSETSGTGIGLYLAKQIIERLDGDIWFDSVVNRGSTFYFSLPLFGSAPKQGMFTLQTPFKEDLALSGDNKFKVNSGKG